MSYSTPLSHWNKLNIAWGPFLTTHCSLISYLRNTHSLRTSNLLASSPNALTTTSASLVPPLSVVELQAQRPFAFQVDPSLIRCLVFPHLTQSTSILTLLAYWYCRQPSPSWRWYSWLLTSWTEVGTRLHAFHGRLYLFSSIIFVFNEMFYGKGCIKEHSITRSYKVHSRYHTWTLSWYYHGFRSTNILPRRTRNDAPPPTSSGALSYSSLVLTELGVAPPPTRAIAVNSSICMQMDYEIVTIHRTN